MNVTDEPATMAPAPSITRLTEHLFRQEAGKLVSVLTGLFGLDRLQMAEDVVQEAMVRALQTWPYRGVPEKPAAWLLQTARNLAFDLLRREQNFRSKEPQVIATIELRMAESGPEEGPQFDDEIKDQRLRLIFACCHPLIPAEAQTALALRTLCGFSPAEIAQAFLTSEAAIAKRLTRARARIQEQRIPFEIPSGAELSGRLEGVLQVLYLLFNEGYKASSGECLVRADLCHEAIQLASLLRAHPVTQAPQVQALLALMFLTAARLPGRMNAEGEILRLEEQDRTLWDAALISQGIRHLSQAATGEELSEYHLQAAIAACHSVALDFASTNWAVILGYYDRWTTLTDSPVVALNRAVVLGYLEGADAAIDAVHAIPQRKKLEGYYLTYAVLGEFEARRGRGLAAASHFRQALELTTLKSEREFLLRKLEACAPGV